jgi:hypothetical protein
MHGIIAGWHCIEKRDMDVSDELPFVADTCSEYFKSMPYLANHYPTLVVAEIVSDHLALPFPGKYVGQVQSFNNWPHNRTSSLCRCILGPISTCPT